LLKIVSIAIYGVQSSLARSGKDQIVAIVEMQQKQLPNIGFHASVSHHPSYTPNLLTNKHAHTYPSALIVHPYAIMKEYNDS